MWPRHSIGQIGKFPKNVLFSLLFLLVFLDSVSIFGAASFPEIAISVKDSEGDCIIVKRGGKFGNEDQEIRRDESFPYSARNVSLVCQGFGKPLPEISWTTIAVNGLEPEYVENATHRFSTVFLPIVDVGVQGTYICSVKNRQGAVSARVRVRVNYPVCKSAVVISAVASFVVVMLILALLVFIRRNRKLKQGLRKLMSEEAEMFAIEDNAFDPAEANAEICALPYAQSLEITPGSLEIDQESPPLGFGEFGIIHAGVLKTKSNSNDDEIRVAVKTPRSNLNVEHFKSLLIEIKIMSLVRNHDNVLKILGASTVNIRKRQVLIVLEFCELGNLGNFLRDRRLLFKDEFSRPDLSEYQPISSGLPIESEKLETTDLFNFSYGVANGMKYLAENRVVHGDLAARNILLTRNREVKISDFACSTRLENYESYAKIYLGMIPWRGYSIEGLLDRKFSLKSDCWSFGILLYEIFSLGELPYPKMNLCQEFVQKLRDGYRNERPEFANDDIYDLMTQCWQEDPQKRPGFSQICDRIVEMSTEIVCTKLNLI